MVKMYKTYLGNARFPSEVYHPNTRKIMVPRFSQRRVSTCLGAVPLQTRQNHGFFTYNLNRGLNKKFKLQNQG